MPMDPNRDEYRPMLRADMKDTAMGETPLVWKLVPVLNSMQDTAMGEAQHLAKILDDEDAAMRETPDKVQAPTMQDTDMPVVDVEFLQDTGLEVLDFTGEVDGGGIKMSMYGSYIEKPPMELVPMALTRGAARALGYGAEKYAPNNWRRGMRWGEVFGALKRHLDAWNEEDDHDRESGLNHLDHAAACLSFLMHMVAHEDYSKMDDRP